MRKKHDFVPKIYTCSGPDSHNEQDTGTQGAITNRTPVPPPRVRTTPHIAGPARRQGSRWLTAARSGSSDNDLRSRWPNCSDDGLRADAAATMPSPTSPLEGRGQAIKAKEPEARSTDGGGDPVGDEDFFSCQHLSADGGSHLPTGRSPLGSSRTSAEALYRGKGRMTQNTNAALAAHDVLGGPPVHAARQPLSRQGGHRGPSQSQPSQRAQRAEADDARRRPAPCCRSPTLPLGR
jgi:hypothetical protein